MGQAKDMVAVAQTLRAKLAVREARREGGDPAGGAGGAGGALRRTDSSGSLSSVGTAAEKEDLDGMMLQVSGCLAPDAPLPPPPSLLASASSPAPAPAPAPLLRSSLALIGA